MTANLQLPYDFGTEQSSAGTWGDEVSGFEIGQLSGQRIAAVSAGEFVLTIAIGDSSQFELQIETSVEFAARAGDPVTIRDGAYAESAQTLGALVGERFSAATVDQAGSLQVEFASGATISVPSDGDYEAWSLVGPDGYRVICTPGCEVAVWSPRPRRYPTYPGLAGVYLEDSYVLDITEEPGHVTFRLEAVLTPAHPAYRDPASGQQYCTVNGELAFGDVSVVEWVERIMRRNPDPAGEADLGNIDSLTNEDGVYFVEGEWGRMRIHSTSDPQFVITD